MIRAVVVAVAALVLSAATASFSQGPGVTAGIDVDTAGNTATSLGTIDSCRSVKSGETFQIDVYARGIPPVQNQHGGIIGMSYNLKFDPKVVHVTGVDDKFLVQSGGPPISFEVIDADATAGANNDPLPAVTGNLRVDYLDLSQNFESGEGVLSRLTLQAVNPGKSTLALSEDVQQFAGLTILDANSDLYQLTAVNLAAVAVDQPCDAAPTPLTLENGGISPLPSTPTRTTPARTSRATPTGASGPTRLAIDAIPTGNTPTSLAKIDACASAQNGETFQVDVTIQDVNDLLAWEAGISFNPKVLEVEDRGVKLFQNANKGSKVVDTSAKTPDNSGRYKVGGFDSADPPAPDSGSGVLARITFKAVGPGTSPVSLAKIDVNGDGKPDQGVFLRGNDGSVIGDVDGDTLFDGPTDGAEIRVGPPCPGAAGDAAFGAGPQVTFAGGAAGVSSSSNSDSGSDTGLIIAIVVGVLAAAAVVSGGGFYFWRRSRH